MTEMGKFMVRLYALILALAILSAAQTSSEASLVLDNEFVRISRVTASAANTQPVEQGNDLIVLYGWTMEPHASSPREVDSMNRAPRTLQAVELRIEIKKHWDAAMRPCAYPMQCTRETLIGNEPIAWTTTLFTNGFVTATTHKVKRGGTLTSSYYTAKGADHIVLIPFTDIKANFGGIEENLKAGQPYFTAGTEVEVNAVDAESRWFVLRLNVPAK